MANGEVNAIGHEKVLRDALVAKAKTPGYLGYRSAIVMPGILNKEEELASRELNWQLLGLDDRNDFKLTDVIVWSKDEYRAKPWLTRVGGIPYRDRSIPWPTNGGKSLKFVAQVCFVDSRDLFSQEIPDVLLMFVDSPFVNIMGYSDQVIVEWVRIDRSIQLPTPEELETGVFFAKHTCGRICRVREIEATYSDLQMWQERSNIVSGIEEIDIVFGTKIGGLNPAGDQLPGDFLCSIGSIFPPGPFLPEVHDEGAIRPKVEGGVVRRTRTSDRLSIGDGAAAIHFTLGQGIHDVRSLVSNRVFGW